MDVLEVFSYSFRGLQSMFFETHEKTTKNRISKTMKNMKRLPNKHKNQYCQMSTKFHLILN